MEMSGTGWNRAICLGPVFIPVVVALLLLVACPAPSQVQTPADMSRTDSAARRDSLRRSQVFDRSVEPRDARQDTIRNDSSANRDTVRILGSRPLTSQVDTAKPFTPTKTPMLAVGLSAVLPGAGQVYDESYWKVPVILGLGGYWVYEWISNNRQYQDYREQYLQSLKDNPSSGNGLYLTRRDFYRDERDKFAWYLGVLYFANLVDAYVTAHLYDFDVTPDLSATPRGKPHVGMAIRLKL